MAVKTRSGVLICLSVSDLAQLVTDPTVELFPLQTQEVVSRLQDATFGGDGSGSVDVVSRDHADGDPSPLALPDGLWHLKGTAKEQGVMIKMPGWTYHIF